VPGIGGLDGDNLYSYSVTERHAIYTPFDRRIDVNPSQSWRPSPNRYFTRRTGPERLTQTRTHFGQNCQSTPGFRSNQRPPQDSNLRPADSRREFVPRGRRWS
jgi:hypothetical protein